MNKFMSQLKDQLFYFWGFKWRVLFWFLIVFSAISYYSTNGNLLLAILNGIGVYGIGYLGVLSFTEGVLNEER